MSTTFLVEATDGSIIKKRREDLQPDDRIVFDGPDAFRSSQTAQRELDKEIHQAGGLEAWRNSQSAPT